MSYQVLARKWRPTNFEQMVGQKQILKTLSSSLEQERLHHAYLFTGTRGVGKTSIARILARCLNCEQGVSNKPCGTCSACVEISEGRFVDLIEVDAASKTKVEDTRELLENVQYRPTRGRYKIYLIDEVHMLSKHSFNALLKTLEEPPPHVIFLLATTDPQMLPPTVLSRCLQFHLKNMTSTEIKDHLGYILEQEKIEFESSGVASIAWSAKGSMRDALSLLDQAIAYGNGAIKDAEVREMLGSIDRDQVYQLLSHLNDGNGEEMLAIVEDLSQYAPNYFDVLDELIELLHRIALVQQIPKVALDEIYAERIKALADKMPAEDVQLCYQIALLAKKDLSLAPDARSGFEMCLLRMMSFRPQVVQQVQGGPAQAKKLPSSLKEASTTPAVETKQTDALAVTESGTAPESPVAQAPEQSSNTAELDSYAEQHSYQDFIDSNEDTHELSDVIPVEHTTIEAMVPAAAEELTQQPLRQQTVSKSTASNSSWDINSILRERNPAGSDQATAEQSANEAKIERPAPTAALKPEVEPLQKVEQAQEGPIESSLVEQLPAVAQVNKQTKSSTDEEPVVTTEAEPVQSIEPVIKPNIQKLSAADDLTDKVPKLSEINSNNWYQVVELLEIKGLAQQIALASQIVSTDNARLVLNTEANIWNTLSPELTNTLSAVLHKHIDEEFSLQIEQQMPDSETPRQRRLRLEQERYQAACDALQADMHVQALQNKFGATLELSEVVPLT